MSNGCCSIFSVYHRPSPVKPQNESCRFELVCARCSTCDDVYSGVLVDTDTTVPVCVDLPKGTTTASSGTSLATISLEKGYYRTSAESQIVLECYQEDACVGGDAADDYCASGYEGPCKCNAWDIIRWSTVDVEPRRRQISCFAANSPSSA